VEAHLFKVGVITLAIHLMLISRQWKFLSRG